MVTDQDDDADTPHVIAEDPDDDEQDNNDDGNEYARELPVPNMEGYPFRQPALDTVFREMFESLQMRGSDTRATVNGVINDTNDTCGTVSPNGSTARDHRPNK